MIIRVEYFLIFIIVFFIPPKTIHFLRGIKLFMNSKKRKNFKKKNFSYSKFQIIFS